MLNYLKYRTQLNTFAGNVLNSHRVQCLENSYFLSAHAHGKCSRDFEVIMKWWWMRISSVRSNMMRILIEKAVLQINKFVPNYMSDFPKMTKGNTSFFIWDNEPSSVNHGWFTSIPIFPLSSLVVSKPCYAAPALQLTKSR